MDLTNLLGDTTIDKFQRGIVDLLGGKSEMAGPSMSEYDKAVKELNDAGFSEQEILELLGPRPNLITSPNKSYPGVRPPSQPMSPGVNEDAAADMMRRMELNKDKGRANGGRIGFREGRQVTKPVEIPAAPSELEVYTDYFEKQGLSRQDAEKAAEQFLFGPDSAMLNDSKKGLGELMRTARMTDDDDEVKDPSDMLTDDARDMFQSDETEILMDMMKSGQLAKLDDDELRRMYDSMVDSEAGMKLLEQENINSFEEYKDFITSIKKRPEGIMQTMVA